MAILFFRITLIWPIIWPILCALKRKIDIDTDREAICAVTLGMLIVKVRFRFQYVRNENSTLWPAAEARTPKISLRS